MVYWAMALKAALMDIQALVVLCTFPRDQDPQPLINSLLAARLTACVNIIKDVASMFTWNGSITTEAEVLLLIKTTTQAYLPLESTIKKLHPYSCPEIIALPIYQGSAEYLEWLHDNIQA